MFDFKIMVDQVFRSMCETLLNDGDSHRNIIYVYSGDKKVLIITREGVSPGQSAPITHRLAVIPADQPNGGSRQIIALDVDMVCMIVEHQLRAIDEFVKGDGTKYGYMIERYTWRESESTYLIKVPTKTGAVFVKAERMSKYSFTEYTYEATQWPDKKSATIWLDKNKEGPMITSETEIILLKDAKNG